LPRTRPLCKPKLVDGQSLYLQHFICRDRMTFYDDTVETLPLSKNLLRYIRTYIDYYRRLIHSLEKYIHEVNQYDLFSHEVYLTLEENEQTVTCEMDMKLDFPFDPDREETDELCSLDDLKWQYAELLKNYCVLLRMYNLQKRFFIKWCRVLQAKKAENCRKAIRARRIWKPAYIS
jgi:hypothetical protein